MKMGAGPLGTETNRRPIDLGTSARTRSPSPGPTYLTKDATFFERIDNIKAAFTLASSRYVGQAIARHTTDEFAAIIGGLIPGLLLALGGVAATTLAGAGAGALLGGVGAVVGGAIGFEVGMAILEFLGLSFLAIYIFAHINAINIHLRDGVEVAWHSCGSSVEIDRAAKEIAEGVGVFFQLLLQAIILYLAKAAGEGRLASAMSELRDSPFFRSCGQLMKWLRERLERNDLSDRLNIGVKEEVQIRVDMEAEKVQKVLAIESWKKGGGEALVKVVTRERGERGLTTVKGYVTKAKSIAGRTPQEMEDIIGFESGTFRDGVYVVSVEIPSIEQFRLVGGYTNRPLGKQYKPGVDDPRYPPGLGAPQWELLSPVRATNPQYIAPGKIYTWKK